MSIWWLSFCDPSKPEGSKFLGVTIIEDGGDTIVSATNKAWELGCNPGGDVRGEEYEEYEMPPKGWPLNVMITPEQYESLERICHLNRWAI